MFSVNLIGTRFKKLIVSLAIILYALLVCIARLSRKQDKPTCVVFSLSPGQVFSKSSPGKIEKFFQEERFKPYISADSLLVECRNWRTIFSQNKIVVLDATFHLIKLHSLNMSFFQLVNKIGKCIPPGQIQDAEFGIKYVKNEIIDPALWQILAEEVRVQLDVVSTQTWMQKKGFIQRISEIEVFRKTMFWYSTNSEPIHQKDSIPERHESSNALRAFNLHLVWNDHQASYLKSLGIDKVQAVGSIVFQERKISKQEPDKKIVVFTDVTPTDNDDYFYNPRMSLATLKGLVETLDEMKIESGKEILLYLKPKRRYSGFHSGAYVSYVKELSDKKKIKILSADSNLYEVISKSDFLISTPYTSTNYIASELSIPNAYFCLDYNPWILDRFHNEIEVIVSKSRLHMRLKQEILNIHSANP